MCVFDFLTSSLSGCNPPKIVTTTARRLNTMISSTENKCIARLEQLLDNNRMVDKTKKLLKKSRSKKELKRGLDALNRELRQYMVASEKSVRKLNQETYPSLLNPLSG